ncbi:unnamed protein product [Rhizoctonia solani]|uniref:Cyanovirin-N domain-containing protein n=1 Tax=Rhizoctonia solani TaxID=456999 RepID=A0A8H3B9H5_9AGAM|nr:unnamed protein product [Rhizoctonia solani]
MRSASIAILSLAAAALGVPFEKRQTVLNGGLYYCTERNFTGICARTPPIDDGCHNFDATFNDQLSSFRSEPDQSLSCLLWSDADCQGTNPGAWIVRGVDDLNDIDFDNIASSYQCKNP